MEREREDALKVKIDQQRQAIRDLRELNELNPPLHADRVARLSSFPVGRFDNLDNVRLEWLRPNYFEFIPKKNNPFAFIRHNGEPITPRNFFTDGGSFPRLVRWNEDLDPFGWLPAYLLHDYEFDQHHCHETTKTLDEVNATLMEAIRTLMEMGKIPNDHAVFWIIYAFVNSPVVQYFWDRKWPKCPLPPYRPELT
jgi:hypothetical protein